MSCAAMLKGVIFITEAEGISAGNVNAGATGLAGDEAAVELPGST